MKKTGLIFTALLLAGCADKVVYPNYTADSLMTHAKAAIMQDFGVGDTRDMIIAGVTEYPPSVAGKRDIRFAVLLQNSNQTYDCLRMDYPVRWYGDQPLYPEEPGKMICWLRKPV